MVGGTEVSAQHGVLGGDRRGGAGRARVALLLLELEGGGARCIRGRVALLLTQHGVPGGVGRAARVGVALSLPNVLGGVDLLAERWGDAAGLRACWSAGQRAGRCAGPRHGSGRRAGHPGWVHRGQRTTIHSQQTKHREQNTRFFFSLDSFESCQRGSPRAGHKPTAWRMSGGAARSGRPF